MRNIRPFEKYRFENFTKILHFWGSSFRRWRWLTIHIVWQGKVGAYASQLHQSVRSNCSRLDSSTGQVAASLAVARLGAPLAVLLSLYFWKDYLSVSNYAKLTVWRIKYFSWKKKKSICYLNKDFPQAHDYIFINIWTNSPVRLSLLS